MGKFIQWTVLTFESKRGEKPVDLFIKQQQPQAQAKIIHMQKCLD